MTVPLWDSTDRRRLVGLCASISGDPQAAEDLAQETLYEVWRNAHKLGTDADDARGHERWVNAIARNVCRRWARTQGSYRSRLAGSVEPEEIADELDLALDLERAELAELLDRALALLPTATRDVLVARYLEESSYAEIASRLGLSADAVSMRVSRGRVMLRRVLETDLRDDTEGHLGRPARESTVTTSVWCAECGAHRLEMLVTSDAVAFRCPHCTPDADGRTHVFDLTNPAFARLLGPVKRPTAILGRAAQWADQYFLGPAQGHEPDRMVPCTRCGHPVRVQRYLREGDEYTGGSRLGRYVDCAACGEQAASSVAGLALAQPEVRAFRRRHSRITALPLRPAGPRQAHALVLGYREASGGAGVDVRFDERTLALLSVEAVGPSAQGADAAADAQADAGADAQADAGTAADAATATARPTRD
jgi:RNA polymerase sigma factor (sigma-70 family)